MPPSTIGRCLDVLRCPVTREPLAFLSGDEIAAANRDLAAGRRLLRDGSAARTPLAGALATADRAFIYRVEDEIAWLLPSLALVRPEAATAGLAAEKTLVKSFYDDFGWVKKADGQFNDTAEFTLPRAVAQDYLRHCNARIGRWLGGGRLLLDAASGAIPHQEYLAYSAGYDVRVCVDFSIRALREARAKLGDRGLYLLGDLTCLPLADGSVDAAISLHTIYHIPPGQQTTAVDELARVTRPGGRVVIVYVWGRSLAMDMVFKVRGWLGFIRRLGRPSPVAGTRGDAASRGVPSLYFQPQNHDWFARDIAARHSARLRVWSAISTAFQTRFFTDGVVGRLSVAVVKTLEAAWPALAGRFGQYPMFIIDKPRGARREPPGSGGCPPAPASG